MLRAASLTASTHRSDFYFDGDEFDEFHEVIEQWTSMAYHFSRSSIAFLIASFVTRSLAIMTRSINVLIKEIWYELMFPRFVSRLFNGSQTSEPLLGMPYLSNMPSRKANSSERSVFIFTSSLLIERAWLTSLLGTSE